MINKIEIIEERISNIQFHIDHVNHVMANPELYNTPENKTEVDLTQYLKDLTSIKQALEAKKEALTNQG
jgi:hypothetical protein